MFGFPVFWNLWANIVCPFQFSQRELGFLLLRFQEAMLSCYFSNQFSFWVQIPSALPPSTGCLMLSMLKHYFFGITLGISKILVISEIL